MEDRKLVLIVGNESKNRAEVAQRLIADERAVVLCPGPPGCPLLREEPCVLTETADVTVIIPGTSRAPEVVAGLGLCAQSSQRVIRPARLNRPAGVDPEAVGAAVGRCLGER